MLACNFIQVNKELQGHAMGGAILNVGHFLKDPFLELNFKNVKSVWTFGKVLGLCVAALLDVLQIRSPRILACT